MKTPPNAPSATEAIVTAFILVVAAAAGVLLLQAGINLLIH